MKKTTFYGLFGLLLFVTASFALVLLNACEPGPVIPPSDNYVSSSDTCKCDSDWFQTSNGVRNTPAPIEEGPSSPFSDSAASNCDFHKWAWQKFLYLTNPKSTSDDTPWFLRDSSITLVSSELQPVAPVGGQNLVLSNILQAGSQGVLTTNSAYSGNNIEDTVYYAIYVNDILKHKADSMKAVMIDSMNFNNSETFPVGSFELKVSWVKISALKKSDLPNYYKTTASINGKTDSVALLGMHVVGVVENHPEFIWATFEHHDMAPMYDWSAATDSTEAVVSSTDDMLFFKKGTTTAGGITYPALNVFTMYKYGDPMVPGNNQFMNTCQAQPENHANIDSLNVCVSKSLTGVWNNYFYNGAIWINTEHIPTLAAQADTLVALGGSLGDASPGHIARGSLAAFNITMETFVQNYTGTIYNQNVNQLTNCLSCHTAQATIKVGDQKFKDQKSPLYLSHLFRSSLSSGSGITSKSITNLRRDEFVDFMKQKIIKNSNK